MDFKKFSSVSSSNERSVGGGSKVQDFSGLKYRKSMKKDKTGKELGIEGRFYIANVLWEALGLEIKNGLRQFTDKATGETVIGAVEDKDAVILKMSKRGKKTRHFKSTRLEAALHRIGVINSDLLDMNQFINTKEEAKDAEVDGYKCSTVFSVSKGETKAKAEFPKKKSDSTSQPAKSVDQAEAPVAQAVTPAPQAQAATLQGEAAPAKKSDDGW